LINICTGYRKTTKFIIFYKYTICNNAIKEDNNTNAKTTTGPESIPSVPITPSPESGGNEDTTIYWDIQ
jgi:hypothetical protein